MAGKYASMFFVSRFQSELDRLFQEALAVGDTSRPGSEWQPAVDIVETHDAIRLIATRGKHENWQAIERIIAPNFSANIQAGKLGKHEVQQQQIGRSFFEKA